MTLPVLILMMMAQEATGCSEILDAGTPGPSIKVQRGFVVNEPAWLVPPGRMCLLGQELAECEAIARPKPTASAIIIAAGIGLLVGAGVTTAVIVASGHAR